MKIMVGALIGMLVLTLGQVSGQGTSESVAVENTPPTFDYWMEVKLDESQKVFAALAKGDFVAIAQSTEKLRKVNTLEGFVRRNPVEYRTQLRSFEFAIDEIAKQAKNENIEGVALGFQQLTLSCVNCHKHLRQNPTEVVR